MACGQCAYPAVAFSIAATKLVFVHQKYFRAGLQAGNYIRIFFVKLENLFGRFQPGAIQMAVQPADDVQTAATPVGDILPLPQGQRLRADGALSIAEAHIVDHRVVTDHLPLGTHGLAAV